ncbi:hypothetical protein K3F44_10275 [Pseudomonas sp. S07E 245]|uniref:hypothetical protein n=1 Tax=unclassified Pseudomonas TaxID=196821 RepID=UPI00111F3958|nr:MULTISPECIES: hypothetical protein [unclassified Pseudomonas]QDC04159.1 hypothetical protein FH041_04055 [Pseudomonas sp. SWI7]QYX54643.1 hypothetical protein K3F44_10275 [Pseudomonas sp. S07E 245]
MIRFAAHAVIPASVIAKLDKYAVSIRPKRWYGRSQAVLQFRDEILKQGKTIQKSFCAWCMLPLGEDGRRTIHRDHIAPKSIHPEWTFLAVNLVLSCEYCNGFSNKGDLPTVKTLSAKYEDCEFYVVHPYLDEVEVHIGFDKDDDDLPVVAVGKTEKGIWTILNLSLDSPGLTRERAKEVLYESRDHGLLPHNVEALVVQAVQGLGSRVL